MPPSSLGIRRSLLALGVVLCLAGLRVATANRRSEPRQARLHVERPIMGMTWKIDLFDEGRPEEARRAMDRAFAELARIDRLISEYKPDSAVSAINQSAGKAPVATPKELLDLLRRGKRYSEISGGGFDVTWRGMGKLWRFSGEDFLPPSSETVRQAIRRVNHRDLELTATTAFLRREGMQIGLGGIAAGYAAGRVAGILREAGFRHGLIDGSGDLLALGSRQGQPWRIGIQHPRQPRGTLLGIVELHDGEALATSGDYERFRIVDGVRYHHIIDARTGYPARLCQQTTVIAPSAEQADALSTTLFILGPEAGLALARQEGAEALLVDAAGRLHFTEGFHRRFRSPGDSPP